MTSACPAHAARWSLRWIEQQEEQTLRPKKNELHRLDCDNIQSEERAARVACSDASIVRRVCPMSSLCVQMDKKPASVDLVVENDSSKRAKSKREEQRNFAMDTHLDHFRGIIASFSMLSSI